MAGADHSAQAALALRPSATPLLRGALRRQDLSEEVVVVPLVTARKPKPKVRAMRRDSAIGATNGRALIARAQIGTGFAGITAAGWPNPGRCARAPCETTRGR